MQTETKAAPVRVATDIDRGLADQLERVAAKNERSIAAELRLALRDHLKRQVQ